MVFCSCIRSKERKIDFVSAFDDGIDPVHIPKKPTALFFLFLVSRRNHVILNSKDNIYRNDRTFVFTSCFTLSF